LAGSFPKASIGFLSNLWDAARIASGLRSLRPLGLHRFWLGSSLDGVGRAHDAVRGKRGAFERTVRGARALRREFPGLGLSFNFTITPGNADEIWPAYRLASGMGLWFGAQMAVNHAGIRGAPRFSWSGGEIEAARRQIDLVVSDLSLREDPLGGRVKFWTYLKEYLLRPRRFFGDCLAGERYAMIDPQGRLFFCPVRKHRTVGSILGGFDAAWSSEKAQAERASIARRRCHCWLHCTANPLLAGLRP
jgi:MoaA/NifB/PqqE/SkfB family radical SAM enzyme